MKDLTIRKHKIDFLELIQMNLKKEDWGKEYVLYTYGDVTISCNMTSFDFTQNKAIFGLTIRCQYNNSEEIYKSNIDYYLSNFSVNDFKRILLQNLIRICSKTDNYGNIIKNIAENNVPNEYMHSFRISEDELKESGLYDEEFGEIKDMSEFIQEATLDALKEKECDRLNIIYHNQVEAKTMEIKRELRNLAKLNIELEEELEKVLGDN